jgi:FAD/FMN-containing dehydrogenase
VTILSTREAAGSPAVVLPDHPDYDQARRAWNLVADLRPAAVVEARSAEDVSAAVAIAAEQDLQVAPQTTGHLAAALPDLGRTLLVRTTIGGVEIDAEARRARVGAGAIWQDVAEAAAPHGLAALSGSAHDVGVVGYVLGGGLSWLGRAKGLAANHVHAIEVVTADGRHLRCGADDEPELFWALRGGGGNFGVVTKWKFRLHALPAFTGGPLVLPATPEVVSRFTALAELAPEELSAIASVMPAPPAPFIPEEFHGKLVFFCMMAFAGPAEAARDALAPFRAIATPLADLVAPGHYSDLYLPEDPEQKPAFSVCSRLMDRLDEGDAGKIINRVAGSSAPMRLGEIRVLGGAMGRVSSSETAFAHRSSRVMVSFIAVYGDPGEQAVHDRWAADGIAELPQEMDRVYVNFLLADPAERIHAAYPPQTLERLKLVKRRYDPENLLRLNRNVTPA